MKQIKTMLPYLCTITLTYYVLPAFIKDTGSAMILMLMIQPLICCLCSFFYGKKHHFSTSFLILTMVLFLPAVYLYYNESALIYAAGYGAAALIGMLIGTLSQSKKE